MDDVPERNEDKRKLVVTRGRGPFRAEFRLVDPETHDILAVVSRGHVDLREGEVQGRVGVHRRGRRWSLVDPDGAVLVEAVRKEHGRFEVTAASIGMHADLVRGKSRTRSAGARIRRRTTELVDSGNVLDVTTFVYYDRRGKWRGREREHTGQLDGEVIVARTVPLAVVALCVLLDLGSWLWWTPRVGHWVERQSPNVGGGP